MASGLSTDAVAIVNSVFMGFWQIRYENAMNETVVGC